MTERLWLKLILGVVGVGFIAARRYKNSDPGAGYACAFWFGLAVLFS
jgi:hypothetical protein